MRALPTNHPSDTFPGILQWYAVHCKPLKEAQAATALIDHLALTVYLPEVRRLFRGRKQRTPFFPGYLFVQANLHYVTPSRINATPGVLRLVAFGELPQAVPAEVIDLIRQRVDDLNMHGGLIEHGFRPGDAVRFKSGPLRGLEATFIGPMKPSERVRVLIDFLGSLRETEVDATMVERAAAPPPRRERRTRGKGRWIKPWRHGEMEVL